MVSSSIFKVFGMTRPGIEPRSPGPLANTLKTFNSMQIKLWALDGNTGNHLTACKQMSSDSFLKNFLQAIYLRIMHVWYICINRIWPSGLICCKTQPTNLFNFQLYFQFLTILFAQDQVPGRVAMIYIFYVFVFVAFLEWYFSVTLTVLS